MIFIGAISIGGEENILAVKALNEKQGAARTGLSDIDFRELFEESEDRYAEKACEMSKIGKAHGTVNFEMTQEGKKPKITWHPAG